MPAGKLELCATAEVQPSQAAELTAAFRQRSEFLAVANVQPSQAAEAATVIRQHGQHAEILERLLLLEAVSAEAQVCPCLSRNLRHVTH